MVAGDRVNLDFEDIDYFSAEIAEVREEEVKLVIWIDRKLIEEAD